MCAKLQDEMQRRDAGNSFKDVRVVGVERIENGRLWNQYAKNRKDSKTGFVNTCSKSTNVKTVNNARLYEGEQYLFHGAPYASLHACTQYGFSVEKKFSNDAFEAHNYSGFIDSEAECGRIYCLMYCRVMFKSRLLPTSSSVASAAGAGVKRKREEEAPSRVEEACSETLDGGVPGVANKISDQNNKVEYASHGDLVYPEYVVYYRLDSKEEELEKKEEYEKLKINEDEEEGDGEVARSEAESNELWEKEKRQWVEEKRQWEKAEQPGHNTAAWLAAPKTFRTPGRLVQCRAALGKSSYKWTRWVR
jgi:hypothetical protein